MAAPYLDAVSATGAGRAGHDRQLREATQHQAVAVTPVQLVGGYGQAQLGEPLEQRGERQLALHPGEGGTEAEVDAVPEGHVPVVGPLEVEPLGVREVSGVAVGRRQADD